jgi:iron complex outermembrane recepter protein
MHQYLTKSLILLAILASSERAVAADIWDNDSESLGGNLSNAYLPANPKKSAIPVTVIDRRMIKASGAQSLAEILRIVPGLVTGHRFGHSLSIGSHGGADEYMRRTNVIIDGRSLFTPVVGAIITFNVPVTIEDIERIEVFRAPAGSEFGSNNMLNTVKIYTASAMEKSGGTVKITKGENHQEGSYIQKGFSIGEAFFTASYSQNKDSGLRNRDDNMNRKQLFLRGDYQLDENNEFTVTTGVSNQDIDVWVTSNPTSDDHDAKDNGAFINATWVRALEAGSVVSNLAHTYINRESYYLSAPVNPFIGRLLYETGYSYHSTTIDSKVTQYFGSSVEASIGGKLSRDIVKSDNLFKNEKYTYDSSAFYGKVAWQIIDGTTLHVGGMFESADLMPEGATSYNFAISQYLDDNNQLRFGYNKGTRLPWIYEQEGARKFYLFDRGGIPYYDVYSVKDLDAEEVVTHDISWLYNSLDNNIKGEIRFYHDEYKSLIATTRAPNPGVNSASGRTIISNASFKNPSTVKGVEMSLSWEPNSNWMLAVSTSFIDIDSHLKKGTFTGNTGEAGPSNTFSMLGERKFLENWKAGGMFTRISGYNWSNGWHLESQEALDLYLQRCFADFGARGFCAKLAGTDLLGGKADFRPEAYRERAYRVEASLEF